nr:hypothetical protein [Erwinia typographi]
MNREETHCDVV